MNRLNILLGATLFTLGTAPLMAANMLTPNDPIPANETSQQKCDRWADYRKLSGAERTEFVKDCLLDLRVPEEQEGGGDGD
ncbi:MAG: hypothetical protein JSW09_11455 [Pseudomonadota bacterium]|nr:MAG: hypothetical protein JSW09_11455 [Pseudomonadota bacterium]